MDEWRLLEYPHQKSHDRVVILKSVHNAKEKNRIYSIKKEYICKINNKGLSIPEFCYL